MACDNYREMLVGSLYDELEPQERSRLTAHLETCASCRDELEELGEARVSLRLAQREVPASPRVVVLPERPSRKVWWWSFAAGFACAALVLGVGLVLGMQFAGGAVPAGSTEILLGDYVTRDELRQTLASQNAQLENTLANQGAEWRQTVLASMQQAQPYRTYVDDRLVSLEGTFNERRRKDLQFVLGEIAQSELRAGFAIDETQQTLRYLALANQPDTSEW